MEAAGDSSGRGHKVQEEVAGGGDSGADMPPAATDAASAGQPPDDANAKLNISTGDKALTEEDDVRIPDPAASETDPLDPNEDGGIKSAANGEILPGDGDDSVAGGLRGGNGSIWLLYLSRFLTAWGDRLWSFGLGMFLFRIRPENLFLMAGYGLARSLTSIVFDAALGAWIDRTGRLR